MVVLCQGFLLRSFQVQGTEKHRIVVVGAILARRSINDQGVEVVLGAVAVFFSGFKSPNFLSYRYHKALQTLRCLVREKATLTQEMA